MSKYVIRCEHCGLYRKMYFILFYISAGGTETLKKYKVKDTFKKKKLQVSSGDVGHRIFSDSFVRKHGRI